MYKIERMLSAMKTRDMCIKHELYTAGDNDDYKAMLDMCGEPYSDELVIRVAEDIYKHSSNHEDVDLEIIIWMLAVYCTDVVLITRVDYE